MGKHLLKGRRGEKLAEETLKANGYHILDRNWRHKNLEIDFITEDDGVLAFVEVKTRNEASFGMPYEAVDWKKEQRLARAASAYLARHAYRGEIRFDIVSILLPENLPGGTTLRPEIRLIKDAFWPR